MMKLRHIPNMMSFLRLLLIAPFIVALNRHQYVWAFYIFVVAGATDGLDGYLARRYQWQSHLGGLIDPLADKLMVATCYICLGLMHKIPWWLVAIVLTRDIIIVSAVALWEWLVAPVVINPTFLSKTNTVLQGLIVFVVLFELAYFPFSHTLYYVLLLTITVTTLASFVHYLWIGIGYLIERFQLCQKSCN